MLTQILAAGAMGVSIFCILKVYDLLQKEQAKENPRPVFLRSIYVFMGFAVFMTLLSLGIEITRHSMKLTEDGQSNYAKELARVQGQAYFSLDKNGSPEPLEVEIDGKEYALAKAFPADFFKDTHLKLKRDENQKLLVVKDNNGKVITFGYFEQADINAFSSNTTAPPPPTVMEDPILASEKLMATGLMYTPPSRILTQVQQDVSRKKADENIANKYLVEFVNNQELDKKLQELAVKILIQPTQMNSMDTVQYEKLIAALSSDSPRKPPWRYYELAQVYLSRSIQQNSVADGEKYREALRDYVENYERQTWLSGKPDDYPVEYAWYLDAKKVLGR